MLNDAVAAARAHAEAAAAQLLEIPDPALTVEWEWRETKRSVRFGAYHLVEMLESTTAELSADARWTVAGALGARVTAARWDLRGLLVGAGGQVDAAWGEEWTIRQTLTHMLWSQDFWCWMTGGWAESFEAGRELPEWGYERAEVPDRFRADPETYDGTLDDMLGALDSFLDRSLAALAVVGRHDQLDRMVRFQRAAVPIRYYPVRWIAHLREHAIQIEKTLVGIGHRPREVERIANRVLSAYGELEGVALQVPEEAARPILETAGHGLSHQARALVEAAR